MMNKKHLFFICLLISWVGLNINSVYGIESKFEPKLNQTCTDDNTLFRYAQWTECDDGTCTTDNWTQNHVCPFGCDIVTYDCKDSPFTINMYIVGAIVVVVVIILLVVKLS